MASIQLQINPNYLQDQNYEFLTAMNKHKIENGIVNVTDINKKIDKINKEISHLDNFEVQQWRIHQQNKIYQLAKLIQIEISRQASQESSKSKIKIQALRQHLRILVFVCHTREINYEKSNIMKIIKNFYFSQYKEDIFPYFKQAGFSTHQFQIISYTQKSFLDFLCCWEDGIK